MIKIFTNNHVSHKFKISDFGQNNQLVKYNKKINPKYF